MEKHEKISDKKVGLGNSLSKPTLSMGQKFLIKMFAISAQLIFSKYPRRK